MRRRGRARVAALPARFEHRDDLPRGVAAVAGAGRLDADVRDLLVQGIALAGEVLEACASIRRIQQRTLAVTREARKLRLDRRVEPDHETARTQHAPVRFAQHRTAAGGQHDAAAGRELGECRRLALAEAGLAFEIEDEADRGAGMRLDLMIEVVERHAEQLGDVTPDRRLAGAHRADEDEVGGGVHGGGC